MCENKLQSKEDTIKSIIVEVTKHLRKDESVEVVIENESITLLNKGKVRCVCYINPSPELPRAGQVCRVWDNTGRLYQSKAMYRQATGEVTKTGEPLFLNHWGQDLSDPSNTGHHTWDNWEVIEQDKS